MPISNIIKTFFKFKVNVKTWNYNPKKVKGIQLLVVIFLNTLYDGLLLYFIYIYIYLQL